MIVTSLDAGEPEGGIRHDLQGEIVQGLRDGQSTLTGGSSLGSPTGQRKSRTHVSRHPTEPAGVIELCRQAIGLAKVVEHLRDLSEGIERRTKIKTKVDGLLQCVTSLRSV